MMGSRAKEREAERADERRAMTRQIEAMVLETAGFTGKTSLSPRVIGAIGRVPRHEFVPPEGNAVAYANSALPIGCGQTISQPYIVALMTELASLGPDDVVLEVGTGCGYQAAVLAEVARQVYTVEVVPKLAREAGARLAGLGYHNVEVREGDGSLGWAERAPFDAILVTAAARGIPAPLVAQLRPGGHLVMPLDEGRFGQELIVIEKDVSGNITRRNVLPVAFVPLTRVRSAPVAAPGGSG